MLLQQRLHEKTAGPGSQHQRRKTAACVRQQCSGTAAAQYLLVSQKLCFRWCLSQQDACWASTAMAGAAVQQWWATLESKILLGSQGRETGCCSSSLLIRVRGSIGEPAAVNLQSGVFVGPSCVFCCGLTGSKKGFQCHGSLWSKLHLCMVTCTAMQLSIVTGACRPQHLQASGTSISISDRPYTTLAVFGA